MSIFRKKVYKIVRNIPYGEVITYKKVAILAGYPGAWRAAGNILNKNKDSKIPCHRVIRSDGKIGGYRSVGGYRSWTRKKNYVIKAGRREN